MGLTRRDLLKTTSLAPVASAVPVSATASVAGNVPIPGVSDWDWPPHEPGDCIVFRQRLYRPQADVFITQYHNVNRVPWRGCAARTVRIERIDGSIMPDGSWRILRFLEYRPETFDYKVLEPTSDNPQWATFRIFPETVFQGIDFGQMWQPWDGTWA